MNKNITYSNLKFTLHDSHNVDHLKISLNIRTAVK